MKKIIILSLFFAVSFSAYSQDCFDKLEQKTLENKDLRNTIDSLNKAMPVMEKSLTDQIAQMQKDLDTYKDLAKYKDEKKDRDTQLKLKNDSIDLLKNQIAEINRHISDEKQKCEQKLHEEKEKGKNEVLADVVNRYKNKTFDDLIKSSTKLSVGRDRQLVGDNAEIQPILSGLETYFHTEELLAKKMDAGQMNDARIRLNQIEQSSALLDKLKEDLEYYKDFNDELKKTIEKLVDLDKRKTADSDAEIQKLKFNEIVSELADYMYNYYDYGHYPYLSDIVLEIIKRKRPDADADLMDLLGKL